MADEYNVSPTPRQIKAINGILAGQETAKEAMLSAGFSEETSRNPKVNLYDRRGVQAYLSTLDETSRQKFNSSIIDRALNVYSEALEANKMVPVRVTTTGNKVVAKSAALPDHQIRIQAADRIVALFKLDKAPEIKEIFEPIDINSPEVIDYNKKFLKFLESQ